MAHTSEEVISFIKNSTHRWQINGFFGYSKHPRGVNSSTRKKIDDMVVDITGHEINYWFNQRYTITKTCPVCEKDFSYARSKRDKTTCSYSCSNTHFRSGIDNPNWKESRYQSTCFHYHEKKCIKCGETNIVEVHHFDENHDNNAPENLMPLCPTHHKYWHSRFKHLVEPDVIEYRNKYLETLDLEKSSGK